MILIHCKNKLYPDISMNGTVQGYMEIILAQ